MKNKKMAFEEGGEADDFQLKIINTTLNLRKERRFKKVTNRSNIIRWEMARAGHLQLSALPK